MPAFFSACPFGAEIKVLEPEPPAVADSSLSMAVTAEPDSPLTPVFDETYTEREAVFTVTVNGFADNAKANYVGLSIAPADGLSFSGYNTVGHASNGVKTFTVTVTYDGVQAFPGGTASIRITGLSNIPSNCTYSGGTKTVSVSIIDGQEESRAIPVNQTNITAFNAYADTGDGLTRHYKLTENVTLPSVSGKSNWTAIGTYSTDNLRIFTGSFNGQDNTISNLTINASTTAAESEGMFGYVGSNGVVKNLGLEGGSVSGNNWVGGVAGMNVGMIENCYNSGSVSGNNRVGGVVGENFFSGMVQYCYTTGRVSGANFSGGVAGMNIGTIQNCYASGDVSVSGSGSDSISAGGVAGGNSNGGAVQNCYASGSVSGDGSGSVSVGGVAGYNNDGSTIQNCYASGRITVKGSGANVGGGGIVGYNGYVGGYSGGYRGGYNCGTVKNCVALNPSINRSSGTSADFGRVVSNDSNTNNNIFVSGNYGRMSMTLPNGINSSPNLNGVHGMNVFEPEWTTANWWQNTAKFPSDAWTFRAGLPTLKKMPSGTQNPTAQ